MVSKIQIEAVATFLMILGAHVSMLFFVEVKVLVHVNAHKLPPLPNYVDCWA